MKTILRDWVERYDHENNGIALTEVGHIHSYANLRRARSHFL